MRAGRIGIAQNRLAPATPPPVQAPDTKHGEIGTVFPGLKRSAFDESLRW